MIDHKEDHGESREICIYCILKRSKDYDKLLEFVKESGRNWENCMSREATELLKEIGEA